MKEERCVCCGAVIPEGRQVCPQCEVDEPLERFITAHNGSYEYALKEIKAGHKETHWMWWIFPQYKGLGQSAVSKYYEIQDREEAEKYWKHPVLGARLRECMLALLDLETNDAVEVFGEVDAMKLKSCLTLFYCHSGSKICGWVLEKFFPRDLDWQTVSLLQKG